MRRNFHMTLVVIVLALLLAAEACVSPAVVASVQTEDYGTEVTVGEVENADGEETSVSEVSTGFPEPKLYITGCWSFGRKIG